MKPIFDMPHVDHSFFAIIEPVIDGDQAFIIKEHKRGHLETDSVFSGTESGFFTVPFRLHPIIIGHIFVYTSTLPTQGPDPGSSSRCAREGPQGELYQFGETVPARRTAIAAAAALVSILDHPECGRAFVTARVMSIRSRIFLLFSASRSIRSGDCLACPRLNRASTSMAFLMVRTRSIAVSTRNCE